MIWGYKPKSFTLIIVTQLLLDLLYLHTSPLRRNFLSYDHALRLCGLPAFFLICTVGRDVTCYVSTLKLIFLAS